MPAASSSFSSDTKLARVRDAMAAGDWDTALRLAGRFHDLGEFAQPIQTARDAINHPAFYQQLGRDVEELRARGIEALKAKYSKSWEASKPQSGNG
jgi:hypothetical protein